MPWTIDYKNIAGLPIEARRLWIRIANDALRDRKDEEYAIKIAWDVIKKAGYKKRGDKWIKECLNMLKTNLKGKLDKLKSHKISYKHKWLIQEAERILEGTMSDIEAKLIMSKIDKATNHCVENEKPETIVDNICSEYISLKEAEFNDEKKEATIVIIKSGFNSNKSRYYTKEALKEAVAKGMFTGKKMYIDHLTKKDDKELEGMPRSIKDWTATILEAWFDGDKVLGRVKIVKEDFWKFLKEAKEFIGTSIDAMGNFAKSTMEGIKTNVVNTFTFVRSVDWVTEAGAGGKVLMLENKKEDINMDWSKIKLDDIITNVPELVDELKEHLKKELKEAMNVDEKERDIERLKSENTELKKKIKESEEASQKIKCQDKIAECFAKVKDMPEQSIKKLKESLKELNIKVEEVEKIVESAIKSEREYLISLKEAGSNIKGLGDTKEQPKNEDKLKESKNKMYEKMGYTKEEIEAMEKL